MNDEEITKLFLLRNESAIGAVSDKYGELLKRVAKKIIRSETEAEECFNDTLLRLWQSIPPAVPNNLRAYSCQIIRNLALRRLKYNLAEKRSVNSELPLDELEAVAADPAAEEKLKNVDFSLLLDSFLRSLSQESRVVFMKRYFFMDSVQEISRDLNISESKVKSLLWRARNKLRDSICKEDIYITEELQDE